MPVFDYEDAARSFKLVKAMPVKSLSRSSTNSSVSVGDAVIEKCAIAKECKAE